MAATEEIGSLALAVLSGNPVVASSAGCTGLIASATLQREVAALAMLLAPIATPRLAGELRRAVSDMFIAMTQVGAGYRMAEPHGCCYHAYCLVCALTGRPEHSMQCTQLSSIPRTPTFPLLAACLTLGGAMMPHASQATSLALCSQLEAGGPAGESLLARLPGVLEGLAEVAEKGLGDALAPFAAAAGPVLDVKAADRALSSLYRDCTAASKAGARHTMPSQDDAGVAQR